MVRWRRGVGNVSVSPTSRCLEQGTIVFAVIKDGCINQQKILIAQRTIIFPVVKDNVSKFLYLKRCILSAHLFWNVTTCIFHIIRFVFHK